MNLLRLYLVAVVLAAVGASNLNALSNNGGSSVELATPPEDGTETFVIMSASGKNGQVTRWSTADGTLWSRGSLLQRGFATEIDEQVRFAPDRSVREYIIRGRTPSGDASERFRQENGRYIYRSPVDQGGAASSGGTVYVPSGGLFTPTAVLAEALFRAPGRRLDLAPVGRATLTPLTSLETVVGAASKRLTAYTIEGLDFGPHPVWFDGDKLFADIWWQSVIREGWESVLPQLTRAQDEAMAKRAPALLARLAPQVEGPLAFKNVRMFDADAGAFRENMTVVAIGGKITQVSSANAQLPSGARVIDGRGKTLVPGLWDSHLHFAGDFSGPLLLSLGITSVRDPGNSPDALIARKLRIDRGEMLGPTIVPMMMIDGAGPLAAQSAVRATDRDSAIAAVRKAKDMGFAGVKLYGSLATTLVPVIAKEARKLGLRVHGHIPRGMRPLDAVRAGYHEITHITMAIMQAMPDSVVDQSNTMQRLYGPARYAADVDLNSPQFRAYVDELKQRGTAVDPTLVYYENGFTPDKGEAPPSYSVFAGMLPPAVDRWTKGTGLSSPPETSRAQMRKSFKKLQQLAVALHRAGIPIVAGTDGWGLELVRELELYVQAGLTPAEALATATIVPARLFNAAHLRGSIRVGKASDLLLVNGDPGRDIGDLRKVELVMKGNRLMSRADLRSAVGMTEIGNRQ